MFQLIASIFLAKKDRTQLCMMRTIGDKAVNVEQKSILERTSSNLTNKIIFEGSPFMPSLGLLSYF